MITRQQQTIQAPPMSTRLQSVVPKTAPSTTSEATDTLTVIRDNLAFLERINSVLSTMAAAGQSNR